MDHLAKASSSTQLRYWSRVFTRNSLLEEIPTEEMQNFLEKVQSGSYAALGVDQKYRMTIDGQSYMVMGVRLSRAKRILFTQKDSSIILIDYLDNHQYDSASIMNRDWFKSFVRHNLSSEEQIQQSFIEIASISDSEGWIPLDETTLSAHDFEPICDYNSQFLELTSQQVAPMNTLPIVVQGLPGSGKTFSGIAALLRAAESEEGLSPVEAKETAEPILTSHILYTSKSPRLVQSERAFCEGQAIAKSPHVQLHFWSDEDYYPRECTTSSPELLRWIEQKVRSCSLSSTDGRTLTALQVLQEFDLLFVLMKEKPEEYRSLYAESFARQRLFPPATQSALCALFEDFAQTFFSRTDRPFVQGFIPRDPLPDALFHTTVLDEGQNATLPELLFLARKTSQARLLILQDPKQNQEWQGVDPLSLFEALFSQLCPHHRFSPRITLSKSYRCGREILDCANSVLKMRAAVIEGVTFKDEEPLVSIEQDRNHPGQVRWYHATDSSSGYDPVREALVPGSTQWAVLTSRPLVPEAQALFGERALVLSFDQAPGIEFQAVVLYHGLNRELLAQQEGENMKRACDPGFTPSNNRSPSLETHAAFIRHCGALFTAITRARDLVVWIEPNPSKKASTSLKAALRALKDPISPDNSRPIPIHLTASSAEEWTQFIVDLVRSGEIVLASSLYERQIASHRHQSFEDWCRDNHIALRSQTDTDSPYDSGLSIDTQPSLPTPSPDFKGNLKTAASSSPLPKASTALTKSLPSPDRNFVQKYLRLLLNPSAKAEFQKEGSKLNSADKVYSILFTPILSSDGTMSDRSHALSLAQAYTLHCSLGSPKRTSFSPCEMAIERLLSEKKVSEILRSRDFLELPCAGDGVPENLCPELATPSVFEALIAMSLRTPNGLYLFLKLWNPQTKIELSSIDRLPLGLSSRPHRALLTELLNNRLSQPFRHISAQERLSLPYTVLNFFFLANCDHPLEPQFVAQKEIAPPPETPSEPPPREKAPSTKSSSTKKAPSQEQSVKIGNSKLIDLLGTPLAQDRLFESCKELFKASSVEEQGSMLCSYFRAPGREPMTVLSLCFSKSAFQILYWITLQLQQHQERIAEANMERLISLQIFRAMLSVFFTSCYRFSEKDTSRTTTNPREVLFLKNSLLNFIELGAPILPHHPATSNAPLEILIELAKCRAHPQLLLAALKKLQQNKLLGCALSPSIHHENFETHKHSLLSLILVPEHEQSIAIVFQEYALFASRPEALFERSRDTSLLCQAAGHNLSCLAPMLQNLIHSLHLSPREIVDLLHRPEKGLARNGYTSILEDLLFPLDGSAREHTAILSNNLELVLEKSFALLDQHEAPIEDGVPLTNMLEAICRNHPQGHENTCVLKEIVRCHRPRILQKILSVRTRHINHYVGDNMPVFDRATEFSKNLKSQMIHIALTGNVPENASLVIEYNPPRGFDLWGKMADTGETALIVAICHDEPSVAHHLLMELEALRARDAITEEDRLNYINAVATNGPREGFSALSLAIAKISAHPPLESLIKALIDCGARIDTDMRNDFCPVSALTEVPFPDTLRYILSHLEPSKRTRTLARVTGEPSDLLKKSRPLERAILSLQSENALVLIDCGADIFQMTQDRATPLILAAQHGLSDLVEKILSLLKKHRDSEKISSIEYQAYLDVTATIHHRTALMVACTNRRPEQGWDCVRLLLEAGASADRVHKKDPSCAPLFLLAQSDQPELLDLMLKNLKANGVIEEHLNKVYTAPDKRSFTPLTLAIRTSQDLCATRLIEAGANFLERDRDTQKTALLLAASSRRMPSTILLILQKLRLMRDSKQLSVTKYQQYLDAEDHSLQGVTALFQKILCLTGEKDKSMALDWDIVYDFLDAGARIDPIVEGQSILDLCAMESPIGVLRTIVERLRLDGLLEKYIARNHFVDESMKRKSSTYASNFAAPLLCAISLNSEESACLLLENGAPFFQTFTTEEHQSPLICAIENNKVAVVRVLLTKLGEMVREGVISEEARLNYLELAPKGQCHRSAFFEALQAVIQYNNWEILELLYHAGATSRMMKKEKSSTLQILNMLSFFCQTNPHPLMDTILSEIQSQGVLSEALELEIDLMIHNEGDLAAHESVPVSLRGSALMIALEMKNVGVAMLFMKYGANILAKCASSGKTALLIASKEGAYDIVLLLLERLRAMLGSEFLSESAYSDYLEAKENIPNSYTAFFLAAQSLKKEAPIERLQKALWNEVIEAFLDAGAKTDRIEKQGQLGLPHFLSGYASASVFAKCLEKMHATNPDNLKGSLLFDVFDEEHSRPLEKIPFLQALHAHNWENANLCLEYEAMAVLYNRSPIDGETPLITACKGGAKEVAMAILSKIQQLGMPLAEQKRYILFGAKGAAERPGLEPCRAFYFAIINQMKDVALKMAELYGTEFLVASCSPAQIKEIRAIIAESMDFELRGGFLPYMPEEESRTSPIIFSVGESKEAGNIGKQMGKRKT